MFWFLVCAYVLTYCVTVQYLAVEDVPEEVTIDHRPGDMAGRLPGGQVRQIQHHCQDTAAQVSGEGALCYIVLTQCVTLATGRVQRVVCPDYQGPEPPWKPATNRSLVSVLRCLRVVFMLSVSSSGFSQRPTCSSRAIDSCT